MLEEKVFQYFYEISKIPRMSACEEKITDYLEDFAKDHQLEYQRDKYDNLIIYKKSHPKLINKSPLILQCHSDMICKKTSNSKHNFKVDALNLSCDGDFIRAKNTSLGADNGIGIAMIMAILDSDNIKHSDLECIFTVREELDMLGAQTIDVRSLHGKKMISLDNLCEKEIWTGSAEATIYNCKMTNLTMEKYANDTITISLDGFLGGHSG